MIAPQPRWQNAPPPDRRQGIRIATNAARRRRMMAQRVRYLALVRIFGGLTVIVVMVMAYLALMANLTSQTYALSRLQAERTALIDENARLDDRIAQLRSRDRLADLAAKLGMHDPQSYAVVAMPAPRAPEGTHPTGIAFLGAMAAGWLKSP